MGHDVGRVRTDVSASQLLYRSSLLDSLYPEDGGDIPPKHVTTTYLHSL
jgi:hypothetical protein